MALATRPRLLLLDEPAAGLSAAERGMLRSLIQGLPRTLPLVLIEHDMSLVFDLADPSATVQVPGVGERASRQLSRQTLAEVIEPRVEELYSLIQAELRRSGFEELLSSGVVLTGGSSLMQGMVELGEEIFHMPVRVGTPNYAGSLAEVVRSPRYSTAVGLLLSGLAQHQQQQIARMHGASFRQVFDRMRAWFQGNF